MQCFVFRAVISYTGISLGNQRNLNKQPDFAVIIYFVRATEVIVIICRKFVGG